MFVMEQSEMGDLYLSHCLSVCVCAFGLCVCVRRCVSDVPTLYRVGFLSGTAAGKTSVASCSLWADRGDCCVTSD